MPIKVQGVQLINELMDSVTDAPDFSFLYEWDPKNDKDTFFPRLNGSPLADRQLKRQERKQVRVAINAVREVSELVENASEELINPKGGFSNAISVFHREGQVSVVAIPVTERTKRALGGFLFAHDIWEIPNAEAFVSDLRMLSELTEGAEAHLKWRWWPVDKEGRIANRSNAAQLLLAVTNSDNRNIEHIANLLNSRSEMTKGVIDPTLENWHQALRNLDSLNDLPSDAVITTLDLANAPELAGNVETIANAFAVRDLFMNEAKEALDSLATARAQAHIDAVSISEFATRVKGQGFPKKRMQDFMRQNDVSGKPILGTRDYTLGDVLRLSVEHPSAFNTKQIIGAVKLIRTYFEDQKRLLGYPRLSDKDAAFEEFMRKVYRLHLEQSKPYPVRSQFDALKSLIEDGPEQVHLVARDEKAVHRLIGSIEHYGDEEIVIPLSAERVEPTVQEARDFFGENPATYQSILSTMGLHALTLEQISGFLAPELTQAIREVELDLSGMKSPLRSYQLFGAQYGFVQKRAILGDEMGLGKTVTALGLMTHLHNEEAKHTLVIVPLAVLENWRSEIAKHTDFVAHMFYGEELEENLARWIKEGGIAVASYESIQKVNQSKHTRNFTSADLVIVDEAHNIKNPKTIRSRNVLPWVRSAERTLLLTGTPIENKIEEFETLIHYAQANLPIPENKADYSSFRKAIAPAYLRRNKIDVLQELPELIDDEEYIELSEADKEYYKRALEDNDYHGARQAKILAGARSSTVQRIQDIVHESMENGRKVLVFSYYRKTIDTLQRVLEDDDPYTPLTGALSSIERQEVVDKFTKSKKPGVLLAQAKAGGTGLNIQAASVVIIVEPQAKPTLEDQMIGRAYRMGQTETVQVIRFRGKGTIDERWVRIQEEKRKVFNATAAVSDAASFDSEILSNDEGAILQAEKEAWGV